MRTVAWLSLAFFLLLFALPSSAVTRHYYIAAEDVTWDYAPSGLDLVEGHPIPQPWAKQTKWPKVRYIEYTDATFKVRKPQPEWLGILGPIIRGEVGDTILVEFFNRTNTTHSIHAHGVRYDKDSEGANYVPEDAAPWSRRAPALPTSGWRMRAAGRGRDSSAPWSGGTTRMRPVRWK